MKRTYAFVQFKTVDQAIAARDATNGGKLDHCNITVDFVARANCAGCSKRIDGNIRCDTFDEHLQYRCSL